MALFLPGSSMSFATLLFWRVKMNCSVGTFQLKMHLSLNVSCPNNAPLIRCSTTTMFGNSSAVHYRHRMCSDPYYTKVTKLIIGDSSGKAASSARLRDWTTVINICRPATGIFLSPPFLWISIRVCATNCCCIGGLRYTLVQT